MTIKPTTGSLVQALAAEQVVQSKHEELLKAGFTPVEGAPDLWEFSGTPEQMAQAMHLIYGTDNQVIVKASAKAKAMPYKPCTSLWAIVVDGWSRDFKPEQTLQEIYMMGHVASLDWIKAHWQQMDKVYVETMEAEHANFHPGGSF